MSDRVIPDAAIEAAADIVRSAVWGYLTPEDAAKQILEAAAVRLRGGEMIPEDVVERACEAFYNDPSGLTSWERTTRVSPTMADRYRAAMTRALDAAPHMATFSAVAAVRRLHRAMPCVDEDGDQIGGFYCEECKDLDDHSGERVHEVYPCQTVREIEAALAGDETYTAMRDRIERNAA